MNKQLVDKIGHDVKMALADVADKHDLILEYRGGTYGDLDFKPKIKFVVKKTSTGESSEEAQFKIDAAYTPFEKDYGKEFKSNEKTHKIIKFKPRATKRPIVARCLENNKEYVWKANYVLRSLHPETVWEWVKN